MKVKATKKVFRCPNCDHASGYFNKKTGKRHCRHCGHEYSIAKDGK